jgi:hypothetical protein
MEMKRYASCPRCSVNHGWRLGVADFDLPLSRCWFMAYEQDIVASESPMWFET